MAVYDATDPTPAVSFGPRDYPDLVEVREMLPEFDGLWNAVRHDFWATCIRGNKPSAR
ncbi:hypothetical protein NDR87_09795 [Nocardia sp. CDC159]|uniref:Uncharacterized protein n=1 Tax=Nocardia pulmonis TaxID=2951408 RepID=A0A9X2E8N6_9NOCA|nr:MULTISPECIES: hypothetical protein [Nocardia]MCM6773761.1 hypothetical protein [Nocardia pulmonis]MCM6786648.1 hypothetical protein [Nocardia sp. CDC159]